MSNALATAKPFLKWAGGKTQLIADLETKLPPNIKKSLIIDRYIEPFIGGGAFFFYLKARYKIKKAYLIDNNEDLILSYKIIRSHPEQLIQKLQRLQSQYWRKKNDDRATFYYRIRKKFNKQMTDFSYSTFTDDWVLRSSYLIFLNKTCFNGLFRLNSKGEFNVPHGRYKNPKIADKDNIIAVSHALKDAEIICADFSLCRKYAKKESLVYFDPPYRPLNTTSYFTAYTKGGFKDDEQIRLAHISRELSKKGSYVVISNSDPTNENGDDRFFEEIYHGFNISRVLANRMVNCNAEKRGQIQELLIANY